MIYTSDTLKALAAAMVHYTHDQWEGTAISPAKIDAHADAWEAREAQWRRAMETVRKHHGRQWDTIDALRKRLEAAERARSEHSLGLAIEGWLHRHLDGDYRPMPNATMRWQWCQRPRHPEDDDCAACLRKDEDALREGEEGCGCICHERVRSLASCLAAALAAGESLTPLAHLFDGGDVKTSERGVFLRPVGDASTNPFPDPNLATGESEA